MQESTNGDTIYGAVKVMPSEIRWPHLVVTEMSAKSKMLRPLV